MDALDDLDDFSHIRTLALDRARPQLLTIQAVPRARLAVRGPFFKYRTSIKVPEQVSLEGQCTSTRMVEIEKSRGQVFEIGLVADQVKLGIGQKKIPGCPGESAVGAFFEVNASQR